MKSTGIVRQVDDLGRIVIPREIRRTRDINVGDEIQIKIYRNSIILSKYQPSCIICGEKKDTKVFKEKLICKNCIKLIAE